MNRLTTQDRVRILTVLSEGMGVNAACRATGASKNTVLKLLSDVGQACALYQDQTMRKLTISRVEVDEIWSFIGMKQKNVPADADPTLGLVKAGVSSFQWTMEDILMMADTMQ